MRHRLVARSLPALTLTLAVTSGLAPSSSLAGVPGPASLGAVKSTTCPKHKGEFGRTYGNVLWPAKVKGKNVLYACTDTYDTRRRTYKLGPWTKASRWSFDGNTVAWTVKRKGTTEDVVWVADASRNDAWVKGVPAAIGQGAPDDTQVSRLVASQQGAAWITAKGTVVMTVTSPQGDPEVLPASTTSTPPRQDPPKLVLVGRWEQEAAAGPALAESLKIEQGEGEGDECGGVNPYDVTVEPVGGQPVGARWWSSWSSRSDVCS